MEGGLRSLTLRLSPTKTQPRTWGTTAAGGRDVLVLGRCKQVIGGSVWAWALAPLGAFAWV